MQHTHNLALHTQTHRYLSGTILRRALSPPHIISHDLSPDLPWISTDLPWISTDLPWISTDLPWISHLPRSPEYPYEPHEIAHEITSSIWSDSRTVHEAERGRANSRVGRSVSRLRLRPDQPRRHQTRPDPTSSDQRRVRRWRRWRSEGVSELAEAARRRWRR